MSNGTIIKVENVRKTFRLPHEKQTSLKSTLINFHKRGYEKQKALDNISFEIKQGEFFGIVGKNGSGKSTLLKLLAGIYTPSGGSIQINGKLTPFIELGVGFNPELTGRENVFLNGALLGFSRKEMQRMYQDIVDFSELERFMDQKLKNYSSGMQVRLAFAISVQAKSEILLLDEVLAVGDAAFQQKCYDYFEQLKQDKRTIVFVTHDMGAVQRFCDRALILDKGKIKQIGDPILVADTYAEDNFRSTQNKDSANDNELATIEVYTSEHDETKRKVEIKIDYKLTATEKVYCGFSVVKNGMTIAEINTLDKPTDNKAGELVYSLDTSLLNPGIYEISASLLKFNNKKPLVHTKHRPKFLIKGFDKKRGGALFLKDSWIRTT